jgi:hypothetical protein
MKLYPITLKYVTILWISLLSEEDFYREKWTGITERSDSRRIFTPGSSPGQYSTAKGGGVIFLL